MSQAKQLKFEDLQPHVDMLCDALENKGASSSGIPNPNVYPFAHKYRYVLAQVRERVYTYDELIYDLIVLRVQTLEAAKDNQYNRIGKIVEALDIFITKEYNKVANEISNKKVGQA
jgi:hypothetical protein